MATSRKPGFGFLFSVPTLPKPIYEKFVAIRDKYGLSSWHMVILGLLAIRRLAELGDKEWLDERVSKLLKEDLL